MMRAFVTGGSGLIGRHVVDALLDHGWDVTVLTRTRDRTRALEARGVAVVEGDVARPRFQSDLSRTDVLFHVAGWIDLGVRDARRMFDVNVTGTANILAMARKEGVSRVVFTGTAGVFAPAPPDRPARESSEARAPTHDPYVVTKFQAHSLVIGEMHAGLPVTVVLPAAVYGPGDTNALGRSLALLAKGRLRIVPRGFGHNTWTHAADIAGVVLEIDAPTYTRRFGGGRVTRSEVLHLEDERPGVTMLGDLTRPDEFEPGQFDCVILTQTLQFVPDPAAAIRTAHKILRPGGIVLATFPGISKISREDMDRWGCHFSFSSLSAEHLFGDVFGADNLRVEAVGNVLTATAFLYGLAAEDLAEADLAHRDRDYELLVRVRAVRADGGANGL